MFCRMDVEAGLPSRPLPSHQSLPRLRGRLKEVRNENWDSYDFKLDAAGYVISESGFDETTRYYERDSAGRVLKETLPSGKFKRYGYDKCGRVTEITRD